MRIHLLSYSLVLISLFLAGSGCRSSRGDQTPAPSQTGSWQQRPLIIDGSDEDWTKPLLFSNRKEKLNYTISNDKDNLYILVSTRSPQEQQKIIQGGMTVWINNQADKNEATSDRVSTKINPSPWMTLENTPCMALKVTASKVSNTARRTKKGYR
jgi:transposase